MGQPPYAFEHPDGAAHAHLPAPDPPGEAARWTTTSVTPLLSPPRPSNVIRDEETGLATHVQQSAVPLVTMGLTDQSSTSSSTCRAPPTSTAKPCIFSIWPLSGRIYDLGNELGEGPAIDSSSEDLDKGQGEGSASEDRDNVTIKSQDIAELRDQLWTSRPTRSRSRTPRPSQPSNGSSARTRPASNGPQRYRLHEHVETSATSSSSSDQANMQIDDIENDPLVLLLLRVTRRLLELREQHEDTILQMISQTFRNWQRDHEGHVLWWSFARLANTAPELPPGVEIGVALPQELDQWLIEIFQEILNCPTAANSPGVDDDVTSLMGLHHRRGVARVRSPTRRRSRHRSRPARRTPPRPADSHRRSQQDYRQSLARPPIGQGHRAHTGPSSSWRASPRNTCSSHREQRDDTDRRSPVSTPSARRWRNASEHADDGGKPSVKEPPYPPPGISAVSNDVQERRTLNMNRVTWRNLLCMNDSAPSHDEESTTPFPLDRNQMTNIIGTIEGMMAQERLLFMCSLVRFVLEMMHQISIAMATDDHPRPHDVPPEDDDDVMMMQTNTLLLNTARAKFNAIHYDLEKLNTHKRQRARALLHAMEHTWGPHIHQAVSTDIQGLLAVLTVHAHENAMDADETITPGDEEWGPIVWRTSVVLSMMFFAFLHLRWMIQ